MAFNVCHGATLVCNFGAASSSMVVQPINKVNTSFVPAANILDHKSMVNIMPFGVCSSIANPSVAAATAAAMGVLTPMPCIPNTPSPWVTGSPTVLLSNQPALNNTSTLQCAWGGVIKIANPGQKTHQIP